MGCYKEIINKYVSAITYLPIKICLIDWIDIEVCPRDEQILVGEYVHKLANYQVAMNLFVTI